MPSSTSKTCSSGVSIADLTLNDFRIDLAGFLKEHAGRLEALPFGTFAVTTAQGSGESAIPPGVIFCLRAVGEAALKAIEPGYPLAPHYVVHVGDDGAVLLPFTQAKQALDRLKRLCIGRDLPDAGACARFDKTTKDGKDMSAVQDLLAKAVASIVGKKEERAVASLFTPGGTHAMKGEFQGINDFEVVAFLVVLPGGKGRGRRNMSTAALINALALPPDARVDQRVPKKLLLEQGAPTAADKRQLQDGIEEMSWVAALKPNNIGVPVFRDDVREYLEIAVLTADAPRRRQADPPHRTDPPRHSLSRGARGRARRHRQPFAGAQTLVAGRDGQGGHRGRAPHGPVPARRAHGGRGVVSRQPRAGKSACPRPVRALSGLARPRGRAGGRPDYRRVCPAGFRRPLDSTARRSWTPTPGSSAT